MNPLSAAYGRVAGLRRSWYSRHPERRQRLSRPVISVGNLVVGGSGKTPIVATIAELLRQAGERPVILSRGYGRRSSSGDVVVVSDGTRVLVRVEESGDEPQMLARHLTGVPIVVSAERYVAGLAAEQHFDPTVMILDDGFQHLRLARDVELLVVSKEDLTQQVLPAGRLRESLDAGRIADAVLVPGPEPDAAEVSSRIGVSRAFTVSAHYGAPRQLSPYGMPLTGRIDGPIVAVAGIARPQRFFAALRAAGFTVARELVFRDHHWFDERDIARVESEANAAGARMVITTEKDAVRLAAFELPAWAYLPMRATVSPVDELSTWLRQRIDRARRPVQDVTAHEGGRP